MTSQQHREICNHTMEQISKDGTSASRSRMCHGTEEIDIIYK